MIGVDYFHEDPAVETTEDTHMHHCSECGLWTHADESCPGPRWDPPYCDAHYDCPLCLDVN